MHMHQPTCELVFTIVVSQISCEKRIESSSLQLTRVQSQIERHRRRINEFAELSETVWPISRFLGGIAKSLFVANILTLCPTEKLCHRFGASVFEVCLRYAFLLLQLVDS